MQASNKNDAMQVYEGATKVTGKGIKEGFKHILKPLSIFSYHYFLEGIKAVQTDGPTKELEKITNLSYDETVNLMEKCQKDNVRVVASERKLLTKDNEFGKKKSLFQQKRITRYTRRIKKLSEFKANYPKISKIIHINALLLSYKLKQKEQIERHKNKVYNVYFNKSKVGYMGDRIQDLVEYRTGLQKRLFNDETKEAIDEINKEGKSLNSTELKKLSEKFKFHEIGNVEIKDFTTDFCIHEISFSSYLNMKDELEVADIPYGMKLITNEKDEKIAQIYFENKHLERYHDLGFNRIGVINVYGNDNRNLEWDIKSQDEIVSFKTKVGDEEKQTYETLSGKNYIMKREENVCVWTVFKKDLKELAEKEKKRDVVNEEIEKLHIFEELAKDVENTPQLLNNPNPKEIEINFDEKEGGD